MTDKIKSGSLAKQTSCSAYNSRNITSDEEIALAQRSPIAVLGQCERESENQGGLDGARCGSDRWHLPTSPPIIPCPMLLFALVNCSRPIRLKIREAMERPTHCLHGAQNVHKIVYKFDFLLGRFNPRRRKRTWRVDHAASRSSKLKLILIPDHIFNCLQFFVAAKSPSITSRSVLMFNLVLLADISLSSHSPIAVGVLSFGTRGVKQNGF